MLHDTRSHIYINIVINKIQLILKIHVDIFNNLYDFLNIFAKFAMINNIADCISLNKQILKNYIVKFFKAIDQSCDSFD